MNQQLLLVLLPNGGYEAHPPYPEAVIWRREIWAQTGGRLTAPNGEPVTYKAVAYNRTRQLVLAERVVTAPEVRQGGGR